MSDFLSTNELDFNLLKENLRTFLRNQSIFQDIDFEASNMNVLLDVLAYNSYLNAYYLNVVGSESFIDSAKLRDTIASHAKELNYLPRSKTSARAEVTLTAISGDPSTSIVVVPKYTKFTATGTTSDTLQSQFTFLTNDDVLLRRISNTEFQANTFIYEGRIVKEKYLVNGNTYQKFILSNKDVDTASIKVDVQASSSDTTNSIYQKAESLYNIANTSNVFFIQPSYNDRYEILFGDGVFGRKPAAPNIVNIEYRVTSGEAANGCRLFIIGEFPNSAIFPVSVTTNVNAIAGADRESVDSIRFNAPRHFQSQLRAVTSEDYKTLIKQNFTELLAVNAYGGETLTSPEYGRVYISATAIGGTLISDSTKVSILEFLKTRGPLSLDVRYVDPIFVDLIVTTNVTYDPSLTNLTAGQIRQLVYSSIDSFNTNNLLDFDNDFRYSKFLQTIDRSDRSILSNKTDIILAKTIVPFLGVSTSFDVDFQNQIKKNTVPDIKSKTSTFTISSTSFIYQDRAAFFGEDGKGTLIIYEDLGTVRNVLNFNAGTINYETGAITATDIQLDNYVGDGITFQAIPNNDDIFVNRDTVMRIDLSKLTINVASL